MKKIINIMLAVLLFSGYGMAQDEIPNMQYFTSPTVASFNKFGDVPVSHYTGVPDISIPVYTIKDGDINIPITLRYHGSGIKVEEEASWVGLGWNLNVGGNVTSRIYGVNDEFGYVDESTSGIMQQASIRNNISDYYSWSPQIHFTNNGGWDETTALADYNSKFENDYSSSDIPYNYEAVSMLLGYCQPDIFSFSFPGGSGKFYKDHRDGNFYQIAGTQPLEIMENYNGAKWVIIDASGVMYRFNTMQTSQNVSDGNAITYMLDEMVYPNGESAYFYYDQKPAVFSLNSPGGSAFNVSLDTVLNSPQPGSNLPDCRQRGYTSEPDDYNGVSYAPTYLHRIVTPHTRVEFKLSTIPRTDIDGEYSLHKIFVKDQYNDTIKEFKFDYLYFNPTGGSTLKRLKLNKFTNSFDQEYHFTYNESVSLPAKTSGAKDYWGYSNGVPGGAVHLPDLEKFFMNSNSSLPYWYEQVMGKSGIPKINRAADATHMKAATLERITYPTGGYTDFIFEPHTFSNYYYEKANASDLEVDIIAEKTQITPFQVPENKRLKVSYSMSVQPGSQSNALDLIHDSYVELYEGNILKERFEIANSADYGVSGSFYYDFEAGKSYSFKSYMHPDLFSNHTAMVTINTYYHNKDDWSIGGGLRIAEIKSYAKTGELSKHKKYTYEEGNTSYGKLMTPLKFAEKKLIACHTTEGNWCYFFPYVEIISNSSIAISNSAGGALVGYDKVVEETIGTGGNGKVTNYYHNEQDEIAFSFAFVPTFPDLQNGALTYSTVHNNTGKLIKTSSLEYSELVNRKYFGIIGDRSQWNAMFQFTVPIFQLFIYPIPASTYVPTKSTSASYFYNESDSLIDSVYIETINEYNTRNLQLTKSTTTNSEGKVVVTKNKYPTDYSLGASDPVTELENRNIVLPVIEQQVWKDGNLVSGKITEFGNFSGKFLPEAIHIIETDQLSNFGKNTNDNAPYTSLFPSGVPYIQKLTMDYNALGKPIGHQKIYEQPVSYVWGYSYQYPIAKIVGLAYADIPSNAMTEINKLDDTGIDLDQVNKNIRDYLPGCMVSTYTYKRHVGMETQTGPDGKTIKYEYDNFGRLETITDKDGNILKHADYHYAE